MVQQSLTIKIDGKKDRISLDSFLSLARDTLAVLKSIDREVTQERRGTLTWCIHDVSKKSPLTLTIAGEPKSADGDAPNAVGLFIDAIDIMNKGANWPEGVPLDGLDKLGRIATLLESEFDSISFSNGRQRVKPTQHINANLVLIVDEHYEWTTIDGRLEAVLAHDKRTFRVYDRLTGDAVECHFKNEQKEDVRRGLYGRVQVTGRATYRAGKPQFISVEKLMVLDGGLAYDDLPKIDMTRGVSSEEHVRKVRDGE